MHSTDVETRSVRGGTRIVAMTSTNRKVSNSTQSTSDSRLSRLSLPATLRARIPETWYRSRSNAKLRRATKAALALRELILDPTTPPTPSTEPHALSLAFVPPSRVPEKPETGDYFRIWTPRRTSDRKSTVPRLRPKDVERLRTQLLVQSSASLVIASARTLEPPLSNPNARIGLGAEPMRAVCLDCMEDQAESMIRRARKAQAGRTGLEEKLGKDKWGTVKIAPVAPARLPVLLSLLGSGRKGVPSTAVVDGQAGAKVKEDVVVPPATHSTELQRLMDGNPLDSAALSHKEELDKRPVAPTPNPTPDDYLPAPTAHDLATHFGQTTSSSPGVTQPDSSCALCAHHQDMSPSPGIESDPFALSGDSLLPFGLFLPASAMSLHRPLAGALPTPETLRMGFDALINAESKVYMYEGPSHVGIRAPLDRMSIYTYWWGFELALPPPSLEYLSHCKQMTGSLLNLLGIIVYAVPGGTRELAPFVGVLSRFIESEWRTLKAQDRGRGVVCAATWFIPAALVARPWDFDDPLVPEGREQRASKAADAAMARSAKG